MRRNNNQINRADLKIEILKDFKSIEDRRNIWEEMQKNESLPTPDADINRYIACAKAFCDNMQPYVILIEQNDQPKAIIVGHIEKHELKLNIGYKTLLNPKLQCLSIAYGGILGQPDEDFCSLLVDEIKKQLRTHKISMAFFNHLKSDTLFYQAVRKMPCICTRGHCPKIDEHWRMSIPDHIDKFYSARSRGHRHNLRKTIRTFEKDYSSKNNLINYTQEKEVDDFLKIAAEISIKTYQRALGAGIKNDEQTKCLLKEAAKNGWFRGHILFADDKPCAFQNALYYNNVYYMVSIGYDPAFGNYKPGMILFLKILESLCADPSINMLDFYFGDAEYKHRYGTEHWPEACAYIFAPRLYPIFINILLSSTQYLNEGLRYAANSIGVVKWIKRKWRNLLRTKIFKS